MKEINKKKEGKYLYFSDIPRQKNIRSYMNLSDKYNKSDIDSLYLKGGGNEIPRYFLLGMLAELDIKKLGKKLVKDLNELELRKAIISSKSQRLVDILEKEKISKKDIHDDGIQKYHWSDFNPYKFMKLGINRKDIKMMEILSFKKILDFDDMKKFIKN